jgi:beta-glucuronidase
VKVDNKRSKDSVPTLNTDWWNYGGITRDVKLVTVPKKFIADHRLALDSEATRAISGWVQIAGAGAGEAVEISVPELGEKLTAKTDASGRATFRFHSSANCELWSPDDAEALRGSHCPRGDQRSRSASASAPCVRRAKGFC